MHCTPYIRSRLRRVGLSDASCVLRTPYVCTPSRPPFATNVPRATNSNGKSLPISAPAMADFPILHRDSTDPETFYAAVWGRVFNHRRAAGERRPRAVVQARSAADVVQAVRLAREQAAASACAAAATAGPPGACATTPSWLTSANCRGAGTARRGSAGTATATATAVPAPPGHGDDGGLEYDGRTGVVACPPELHGAHAKQLPCGWRPGAYVLRRPLPGRRARRLPAPGRHGMELQGACVCTWRNAISKLSTDLRTWHLAKPDQNWGWACESMVGIDVVTADGQQLHCSQDENADLFWAARGSGPGAC